MKKQVFIYLRRQQERGLMQKARRFMDENSVSFRMFLIVLSSITLGSESQNPRVQRRSEQYFVGRSMRRSQNLVKNQ